LKVLFDANVLLSALTTRSLSVPLLALESCEQRGERPYTTKTALAEVRRHLLGKFKVPAQDADRALDRLASAMSIVTGAPELPWSLPDPDDAHLFDAAVFIDADLIVTGDKALQGLRFPGLKTRVLSPRAYLDLESFA
jgi:predicted nucleic acid-binding protein